MAIFGLQAPLRSVITLHSTADVAQTIKGSTMAKYAAQHVRAWLVEDRTPVTRYGILIRRREESRNDHMFHAGSGIRVCYLHGQQKRSHN